MSVNLSIVSLFVALFNVKTAISCTYDTCPVAKSNATNVHLISHTHWDAGWVRTFEEYYQLEVSKIIPSVLASLSKSPDRRFTFVESSFIARWWSEQSNETRTNFTKFLEKGQITFTSGGWVMNDMASPRYQAIIDQITVGHQFLRRTFGECGKPKVGWQIDPFGHSKEQASLYAEIGFDGQFLGRIDYQDKEQRRRTQRMEFIWDGSRSLQENGNIFTSTLMELYWNEEQLCFDVKCNNQEINDFNSDQKLYVFLNSLMKQKAAFTTNHLAFLVGGDFQYSDAERWYRNLDILIANANNSTVGNFNVFYSNPQCYIKAVHDSMKEWPMDVTDFFPYADKYNAYWSGYFTSRPSLKYNVEYSNNVLQAAKQLSVLANLSDVEQQDLKVLKQNVGTALHHDAIAGTSKQYVAEDYSKLLYEGVQSGQKVISAAIRTLLLTNDTEMEFCNNLNTSECTPTETLQSSVDLIVYNPLAHVVKRYISLPVSDTEYRITTKSGELVSSQVVPVNDFVKSLPDRLSSTRYNLVFTRTLLPLSISLFTVTKLNKTRDVKYSPDATSSISNSKMTVNLDPNTGLVSEIVAEGKRINVSQNFYVYDSTADEIERRFSGAYMLRVQTVTPYPWTQKPAIKIIKGEHVQEIQQNFTSWISQTIRLYKDNDFVEFEWFVGPIPTNSTGMEVVSRFDTNFDTNGIFFTDSNARETLERKRNFRSTWNLDTTERVGSNYYPVTGWIFIRDNSSNMQLTVLPDRCQGGSSILDGSVELMVHRRLLRDDFYGVDEALNEPGVNGRGLVATGKHRLFLTTVNNSIRHLRVMHKAMNVPPILAFTRKAEFKKNRSKKTTIFRGISRTLPPNIHLLTLEPWENSTILIRIEHLFEFNEDSEYSRPRKFDLQRLFTQFRIIEVVEMNLSANERREKIDQQRFKWKSINSLNYTNRYGTVMNDKATEDIKSSKYRSFVVTLNPMEIKTFLLRVENK